MQVTAQHAEAISEASRVRMKERFLLDGIALESAHVSPRDIQLAALVVTDVAYSGSSFGNGATMAASRATELVAVKLFDEIPFTSVFVEDFL